MPLPALDLLLGALGGARLAYTSIIVPRVATTHLLLSGLLSLSKHLGSFQEDTNDMPYNEDERKAKPPEFGFVGGLISSPGVFRHYLEMRGFPGTWAIFRRVKSWDFYYLGFRIWQVCQNHCHIIEWEFSLRVARAISRRVS
jgi:hypothetical protein